MLIMMSSEEFSSTEELYDEASSDEVLNSYHPESQMRYYENVVYIPHVLAPVMLVEYVPVLYNYLTYEPYLMNSYQVTYIPFIQQVSYSYFVPYYYSYSPPEDFSSYTPEVLPHIEAETDSNSYSESSLVDESTSDDLSSSISYSDETSVLSLSSSHSYNSYEVSNFSSTQEPSVSLEGVVCNENDDSFDLNCVEEHSIDGEYTEGFVGVDVGSEANVSSTSLLLLDDENSPAALDYLRNCLDQISFSEDRHIVSDVSSTSLLLLDDENSPAGLDYLGNCLDQISFSEDRHIVSDVSSTSLLLLDDENSPAALDYLRNCLDQISFSEDRHLVSDVSSTSLLADVEKLEVLRGSDAYEASSLIDVGKDEYKPPFSPGRCGNFVVFDDSIPPKSRVSDLPLLDYVKMSERENNLPQSDLSPLKDVEKDEYERHLSPERCGNLVVFDDDIASKSCVSDLPLHDYVKKSEDKNKLQQNELSSLKNENVKRYDSRRSSSQMPAMSQEISLQKPDSLDKIDVKVPDPFDYDSSENERDSDGDLAITLQDILASDENWGVKRKEYLDKRRNTELYRSALEGDIRPRRSLPEVGTLATIFEDLPYPINEPYDDGVQLDQESVKEEYSDLPPLEVERSKSSRTTLLPKKKRFRKTRKFFSGLFRCFRPPP